ncbi:MAG: 1-acyl-sn-glycerol-3-phosphate acyltransferase [Bacilli bacterium]|nr:1-acyl-sn-glycerol-3-phosphate acyltransferase [Bacilli bacterium]
MKINDDYGFIPKNLFIDFITDILIRPIALILYFIAKIFLGFKVTDKENLIKNRGVVTVSKHIHYIDCVLIGLITFPRKTYFPALEENFKIPFIRHTSWSSNS